MAWIKSFQELGHHPKTKRAARFLGISCAQLVGHLHYLWWWALDYAEDGSLTGYSPEDIADVAGWESDASAFIDALLRCGVGGGAGFLDRDDAGELRLHDWNDYAGRLVERRATERARQRNKRSTTSASAPTSQRHTEDVGATLAQHTEDVGATLAPRVEKSRVEKSRIDSCAVPAPSSHQNNPDSLANPPEIRADIADVWAYYREKIQPKARICPVSKIRTRLKRFSVTDLKMAIDRFAANYWWFSHNANQGGEWFFRSDARIDQFLLLEPETREQYEARTRRNGADLPRASPSPTGSQRIDQRRRLTISEVT